MSKTSDRRVLHPHEGWLEMGTTKSGLGEQTDSCDRLPTPAGSTISTAFELDDVNRAPIRTSNGKEPRRCRGPGSLHPLGPRPVASTQDHGVHHDPPAHLELAGDTAIGRPGLRRGTGPRDGERKTVRGRPVQCLGPSLGRAVAEVEMRELPGSTATVEHEGCSRHVGRGVRAEEHNRLAVLIATCHTTEWYSLRHSRHEGGVLVPSYATETQYVRTYPAVLPNRSPGSGSDR